MAARMFISYRRDDRSAFAGRINDRLEQDFGRDALFLDVDSIPLGSNFVKAISEEVAKCDVLLAIIGPGWLDARDEEGRRRLDNENDFVRVEIAAALKRDIPVIPILLDSTPVPKAPQLPDDLKALAERNGINLRHDSFRSDMDRLVRGLRGRNADQAHGGKYPRADRSNGERKPQSWWTRLEAKGQAASRAKTAEEQGGRLPPLPRKAIVIAATLAMLLAGGFAVVQSGLLEQASQAVSARQAEMVAAEKADAEKAARAKAEAEKRRQEQSKNYSASVSVDINLPPLSEADVRKILGDASKVLQKNSVDNGNDDVACDVTFSLNGSVRSFGSVASPTKVTNEQQRDAVHGANSNVTGADFHIKVVEEIAFCRQGLSGPFNGCSFEIAQRRPSRGSTHCLSEPDREFGPTYIATTSSYRSANGRRKTPCRPDNVGRRSAPNPGFQLHEAQQFQN